MGGPVRSFLRYRCLPVHRIEFGDASRRASYSAIAFATVSMPTSAYALEVTMKVTISWECHESPRKHLSTTDSELGMAGDPTHRVTERRRPFEAGSAWRSQLSASLDDGSAAWR